MSDCTYEEIVNSYMNVPINEVINRKLIIHKQLEQSARTYVVYSDLHGSYRKFLYWLKNGLGHYQIAIETILGTSYIKDICEHYVKLLLVINYERVNVIESLIEQGETMAYKYQDFFGEPVSEKFIKSLQKILSYGIKKERVIEDLLKILRKITKEDEHRIMKVVPPVFMENILTLFFKKDRPSYHSLIKGITDNDCVFQVFAVVLVKLTLINMFDKHVNLGDTFDRGNEPDHLIALYKMYFSNDGSNMPLHYILGNHDILWMGASIGSPMLCATALRISMRYNNIDFLYRYGFDLSKLKEYALSLYHLNPTGVYGKANNCKYWSQEDSVKMAKVLLILEEKLTIKWLEMAMQTPGDIDYTIELKRHKDLLSLLPTGLPEEQKTWNEYMKKNPLFSDVYFPTIDPADPSKLTHEEEMITEDIVNQFTTLPRFQNDMRWFFEKGETYRVVDNTLFFHAAIPSTTSKDFETVMDYKGKSLLDFIQNDLKRIQINHKEGNGHCIREKVYFWHLWCGPSSPFFCKSKMATLECAVFNEKEGSKSSLTTWKEEPDPYYKNIRDENFLSKIFSEFHADNVCMGHVPVKGITESILSDVHGAFIVDGGASEAYGDRGEVLIKSPDFTYVTMHPPLNQLILAESNDSLPHFDIRVLEQKKQCRIRDMDKGYSLKKELSALEAVISRRTEEIFSGYFTK